MNDRPVLLCAATTGYQVRAFGDVARRLGVPLAFATDRCDQLEDPWWDQAVPIRFHAPDESADAVVSAMGGRLPRGVLAVGDPPVGIAARVADRLGLPWHPPAAADASRIKLAFREALAAAGLPHPWFTALAAGADLRAQARTLRYPCVVKPLSRSGSQGVMRVDSAEAFESAVARIRRLLALPDVRRPHDERGDVLLAEAFIPGREYAIEGLMTAGTLEVLAIFDKPDPLDGPFFEETIYVTPCEMEEDVQARLGEAVAAAARALGLRHGAIHAECRVSGGVPYVIEVAARPIGGLCARALRFGDGRPLEELLLRHALGEDVSTWTREAAASGVMMIPIPRRGVLKGVAGVEAARAVPYVRDVAITAGIDQVLVPLPEGRSYLGFIFARAAAAPAVVEALRAAHARLSFLIDREVPVVSHAS
ncbi:MAG: ATP-grasp domain-containing protein [Acidimicrobiia bacterium]|nr:ATP-grasp domain-containing protein [Acidimicrobiia bacterium]